MTVVEGIGLVPGAVDVHAAQWGNLSRLVAVVAAGLAPQRRRRSTRARRSRPDGARRRRRPRLARHPGHVVAGEASVSRDGPQVNRLGPMRAITIPEPGDADALVLDEVPDPEVTAGDVLIDVAAAGSTAPTSCSGSATTRRRPGASELPGLEVSGRIAALGDGVEGWQVGDEVCALLDGGGYAERVVAPAGQVLPVPRGVSLVDAAGLPEVACTVWSNVFLVANIQPGQVLLVHGGSSGIGTMAIQLAKAVGAHVAVTAGSQAKLDVCRDLGAEFLVNYREEDFVERVRELTKGHGADVILDNMGAKYLARNVEALAISGRLVTIGLMGGRKGELDMGMLLAKRARRHRDVAAGSSRRRRRPPSSLPSASTCGRSSSPAP